MGKKGLNYPHTEKKERLSVDPDFTYVGDVGGKMRKPLNGECCGLKWETFSVQVNEYL